MDASVIWGVLIAAAMVCFLLFIRLKDLPKPAPVSPFQHLEERKAAIYENLRDLQFEYRLDKLSDEDYKASKLELQKELAHVMAETDRIKAEISAPPLKVAATRKKYSCAGCGATFDKSLKFCGECGKPMGQAS